MKILIVSAGSLTSQIGGGQSYTQDLVLGLKNLGYDVCILEPINSNNINKSESVIDYGSWQNIPIWSVKLPLQGESLQDINTQLGKDRINLFKKIINDLSPGFVLINSLMPTTVEACNILGIKHCVVAHHPGEVCPKGDLLNSDNRICMLTPSTAVCVPCILSCKKAGYGIGKIIARVPTNFLLKIGRLLQRKNPIGYIGRTLLIPVTTEQKLAGIRQYIIASKLIVAPSKSILDAIIRTKYVKDEKIKMIHHGIHPVNMQPLILSNLNRPIHFGYIGRIDHAKGLHILLEAMQKAQLGNRAELHVYGEATNLRDKVIWDKILKKYSHNNWLYIHGRFERSKLEEILNNIDVLVLPSIYLEVFGLVVAESLSAGRPVLTSNCGGPAEQVIDNLNGWIVEPNDAEELASKLLYLTLNPNIIINASAKAKESVKSHNQYLLEIQADILKHNFD